MSSNGPAMRFVVGVGASAGGLRALVALLSALPKDFSVPILVVQHVSPNFVSHLPAILAHQSGRRVLAAEDGMKIEPAVTYVAPPNYDMTVGPHGRLQLESDGIHGFTHPSIDALFYSMAEVYGVHAIVIVLTGGGSDGTAGAASVHKHGGYVIVQSPDSSEHSSMPTSVIEHGYADQIIPLTEIAERITGLTAPAHG